MAPFGGSAHMERENEDEEENKKAVVPPVEQPLHPALEAESQQRSEASLKPLLA